MSKWVAHSSNETGRFEVKIRSFPDAERGTAVSSGGGWTPRWSPDGRLLYFNAPDEKLMVAKVQTEPTLRAEMPRALLEYEGSLRDIAPDGKRFVGFVEEESEPPQLVVIPDFAAELKAKFREAEQ